MSPKDVSGIQAAAEQRTIFQLFKVALRDGTILRYTDADADLAVDAGDGAGTQTWLAGVGMERDAIRESLDLQIGEVGVKIRNVDLTIGAITRPIAHWVKVRKFHGAAVSIYLHDFGLATPVTKLYWAGSVQGAPRAELDEIEFTLENLLAKLDVQVPRTYFQRECNRALYDVYCGVDRDLFEESGSVVSATISTVTFTEPATPFAAGWFDLGEIEFASGNLAGLRQTIATHASGLLTFFAPFPEVPDAGSTFLFWPGCHKTIADCRDKFGSARVAAPMDWFRRFHAFPFMPEMDETIG